MWKWVVLAAYLTGFVSGVYQLFPYEQARGLKQRIWPSPPTHWEAQVSQFRGLCGQYDAVIIGDSLVSFGEWSDLTGLRIANRGIRGETVAQLRQRLDTLDCVEAERIVILSGVNDLVQGRPIKAIVDDYRAIVDQLGRVTIVSVPLTQDAKLNRKVKHLNARLSDIADFIDLNVALAPGGARRYTTDGIHFDGPGYRIAADILFSR